MAKDQFLNYTIHLTDQALVTQFNAQYPDGVIRAPEGAEIEFAAPIQEEGTSFSAPCIRSPWFASAANFQRDVAMFRRKSGGWFGIGFLFGSTTKFYWVGRFVYAPPVAGVNPVTGVATDAAPIMRRRWIDGFELPGNQSVASGEGSLPSSGEAGISRGASRLPGGYGLALRGPTTSSRVQHAANDYYGVTPTRHWDRIYVCRRNVGAGFFWGAWNASAAGCKLQMLPNGDIAIWNGNTLLLKTTINSAFALHAWHLVDILVAFNPEAVGGGGSLAIYIDHVLAGGLSQAPADGGIGSNSSAYSRSFLGAGGHVNDVDFALDVDDWIGAQSPEDFGYDGFTYAVDDLVWSGAAWWKANAPVSAGEAPGVSATWTALAGALDWINGSHVQLITPTGLGPGHTGWAGGYEILQNPAGSTTTGGTHMTSSTSGARLELTTDAEVAIEQLPGGIGASGDPIGAVALTVGVYSNRASGLLVPSLGWQIAGGADDLAATLQTSTALWMSRLLAPGGGATVGTAVFAPFDVTPLVLVVVKGADAVLNTVYGVYAVAEVVGQFQACDTPVGVTPAPLVVRGDTHNAPYPRSPWVATAVPPISPVGIIGGTFVGTGTFVDLQFKVPVGWFLLRRATATLNGASVWWSAMVGAHRIHEDGHQANIITAFQNLGFTGAVVEDDQETEWTVRIAGSHDSINALGETYQYIAVCDPGMRFLLCGAMSHHNTETSDAEHPLASPAFTPIAGFFQFETQTFTTQLRLIYKGPGHSTEAISLLPVAETASALAFEEGHLLSRSAFHTLSGGHGRSTAYALFRRDDGSEDEGLPRVVYLGSYVGDGAASRTFGLTPATGRRPLFALIVPHSAATPYFRDPSHTTNTSGSLSTGTTSTTAITAGGIDAITIGTTLNANGTTYDVFILWGSDVAGNGGWSVNGEFYPVEPTSGEGAVPDPADQGLDDEGNPLPDDDDEELADPGDLTTDISIECAPASTRVCNIALSRIGVSKKIVSLGVDVTEEAEMARTVYKTEIDATLRDFPWPFATRYATLTLVAGEAEDPVNGDWTYAYRLPTNALFVRRVVNPDDKRGHARTPIAFRLGQDATGELIYTDEPGSAIAADAAVTVEYTLRIDCPASRGDAIFRSAAAWRLAGALVAPLARDLKLVDYCQRRYDLELLRARTVHLKEQEHQTPRDGDADWITGR